MGNGAQQTQLQCSICDSTVVQLAALEGGELDGCYSYAFLLLSLLPPPPDCLLGEDIAAEDFIDAVVHLVEVGDFIDAVVHLVEVGDGSLETSWQWRARPSWTQWWRARPSWTQ